MKDQAEKLRMKMSHLESGQQEKRTKVITVTSGKGGVGKSNFSLNFALSLIKHQQSVVVLDVDFGLANLDVLMGLSPTKTITDLLHRPQSVWDIMEVGPLGLKFIAGGSGFEHVLSLDEQKINLFMDKLQILQGKIDFLILDTGAGLSEAALKYMLAADEVIVVTTPEPTSITDAYAVLKMIHANHAQASFRLVINRSTSTQEGTETAARLKMVAKQFLNMSIDHLGNVPDDPYVSKAVKKQIPFLLAYPQSQAALSLTDLTRKYLQLPDQPVGGVKQFLKKFMRIWDGTR